MIYEIILRKHDNTRPLPTQDQVFDRLFNPAHGINTPLTSLIPTKSGFIAKSDIEKHINKIHERAAKLNEINLAPVLPPQVIANRTVNVYNVDSNYTNQNPDNIKTQITTNNNNAGINIEHIILIPNNQRMFKILCKDEKSATLLLKQGFYAQHYRFSPTQLSPEKHINLIRCFKCYKLNSHTTTQCTSAQLCSNCAEGHHHSACPNANTIKCVNCRTSSHHTLAFSCPYRKNIIKTARKSQNPPTKAYPPPPTYPLPLPSQHSYPQPPFQPWTHPSSSYANILQNNHKFPLLANPTPYRPSPTPLMPPARPNHQSNQNTRKPPPSHRINPEPVRHTHDPARPNPNIPTRMNPSQQPSTSRQTPSRSPQTDQHSANTTPPSPNKKNAHKYVSDIVTEKLTQYIKDEIAEQIHIVLTSDILLEQCEVVFTQMIKEEFLKSKSFRNLVHHIKLTYGNSDSSDSENDTFTTPRRPTRTARTPTTSPPAATLNSPTPPHNSPTPAHAVTPNAAAADIDATHAMPTKTAKRALSLSPANQSETLETPKKCRPSQ